MPWFASEAETYDVEVILREEDEDGQVLVDERATVTLKRLSAGEHAVVQDAMFDDEQGEGHTRLVLVQAVVVAWTIPGGPPTEARIVELDESVFLQIYAGIKAADVNPFAAAARASVLLAKALEATTNGVSHAPVESASVGAD